MHASQAVANYYQLLTDVGGATLKLLQRNALTPRVAAVAGVNQRTNLQVFSAQDLDQIELVRVVPGNPILRTLAGREYVASKLMAANLVTKEEFFTVLSTGELRPLTRSVESQLDVIHDENEVLLGGGLEDPMPQPLIHDDHVTHIKEHTSLLDSTEMRTHPIITPRVLAHVKQHMELMFTPAAQEFAMLFGYPPAMAPMGMAAGPPGGAPKPAPKRPGAAPGEGGAPPGESSKSEMKAQAMATPQPPHG